MKLVGFTMACLLAFAAQVFAWETFKNCRLLPNPSNDGDSFHVDADGKEYIFRLYFVDTPESSTQIETRVAEQAAAFGVSEYKVLKGGKDAAKFTEQALRGRFTVVTKFQDARGASAMPRNYAMIRTADGKDLAELLVGAGLARAFGVKADDAPGAPDMTHYKQLEAHARRTRAGIFGGNGAVVADIEEDRSPAKPRATPEEPKDVLDSVFARLQNEPAPAAPKMVGYAEIPGYKPSPAVQSASPQAPPAPATPAPSAAAPGKKVSLNRATQAELESLPGIGPATAKAIIAGRPYDTAEDLLRVHGIGVKKFEAIAPLLVE